jgi:hypothetical protein
MNLIRFFKAIGCPGGLVWIIRNSIGLAILVASSSLCSDKGRNVRSSQPLKTTLETKEIYQ